ncbi:unnamed protein product, partial [Heterosigma akashiwo]
RFGPGTGPQEAQSRGRGVPMMVPSGRGDSSGVRFPSPRGGGGLGTLLPPS